MTPEEVDQIERDALPYGLYEDEEVILLLVEEVRRLHRIEAAAKDCLPVERDYDLDDWFGQAALDRWWDAIGAGPAPEDQHEDEDLTPPLPGAEAVAAAHNPTVRIEESR